jgi:hypothetical protein
LEGVQVSDNLLSQYKQQSQELSALEARVEELRASRMASCKALFERDGKGHVYDLGDGQAMIIVQSKSRTHFFTPRDKWKNKSGEARPRVSARASESVTPRIVDVSSASRSGSHVGDDGLRGRTEVAVMLDEASGFSREVTIVDNAVSEKGRALAASTLAAMQKDASEEVDPLVAALAEIGTRV